MTKTQSSIGRAEILLKEFGRSTDGSLARHNALQDHGGAGHAAQPERRLWAEAWQLLEQARLICREAEENRGSRWFLTGAGRQALSGGDIAGSIQVGFRTPDPRRRPQP